MEEVCLPVQRTHMGVVHLCKQPFQTICGADHHTLKSLCSVRQPKWSEQILKQAYGVIIAVFGMSAAATGIW
jgi:hypothetical protein